MTLLAQSGVAADGAADHETTWLTGDALQAQLERPVSLRWQQTPVRDGLMRLARVQQVAIFLDRTLDPDRKLDLNLDDQPLREALEVIAEQLGGSMGRVGPVVYMGPPFISQRIATLAELQNERVAERLADRSRELLRPAPLRWDVLAEPRQLIQERAAAARLQPGELALVPHDVWPAYDLPPMTWAEQMTLLLAGFRMSFTMGPPGDQLQWTTFPQNVSLKREYHAGSHAAELAKELVDQFPQASIDVEAERLIVSSTLEDHWMLARRLRANVATRPRAKNSSNATSRFTLTVKQQPIRKVLEAVAAKLDRTLIIDDDVELDDNARTSFSVSDATEQELLDAIVAHANLSAELDEDTIRIHPLSP